MYMFLHCRVAYFDWQRELGMYRGPDMLPQRAAKLWKSLRTWFAGHIPEIAATLTLVEPPHLPAPRPRAE
jgi:hypothetical protein